MPTTVKLKNSVTTTNAPISLQQGEVAINITDKKVWVGNAATTPVQLLGTGANGSFTNLEYSGTLTGGTGVVDLGSGQFYKDASGSVGIGTITPQSTLDIKTSGGALGQFRISTNAAILYAYASGVSGANGVGIGASFASGGFGPLIFETSSQEQMRITSAGNVGIGTSSPTNPIQTYKLGDFSSSSNNIRNLAYFQADTTVANSSIIFNTNPTSGQNLRGFQFPYQSAIFHISRFHTDKTTGIVNDFTILDNGNIGIGDGNPAQKFVVSESGTNFVTSVGGGVQYVGTTTNHPMALIVNSNEYIRIHASGGVSIGNTTDPSAGSLSVNNNLIFNSGYGSPALAYGCRAWATFDGSANSDQTGTYTQSGTTVIVTVTAHGFTTGQAAFLDFTSGTAVDGSYIVTVVDANEFTVVQASRITTGFVTVKKSTIISSGNVSSISDNGTGTYTINFTTAMPDDNYALTGSCLRVSGNTGSQFMENEIIARTTSSVSVITTNQSGAAVNPLLVSIAVFR